MTRRLILVLLVTSYAAAAAGPVVQTFRVPEGGICPQAQTDARGVLHLIYFKGDPSAGDIMYVRSEDAGQTFTKPLRVNSMEGSAMVIGTIRGPQLAVGRGGRAHVAWMGSGTAEPKVAGKEAPMLYARLNDDGAAFEPQRNVIQAHPGLDGGGSVAADGDGNVYVAWHAPKAEKTEADRWVWIVRSPDDGKTFGPESAANPRPTGACGCCGMKVFAGANGTVYILYRTATDMVHRDMHVLASKDHAQTFDDLLSDEWNVAQCVMSTSAIAPAAGSVVAAWETRQQIRFARIDPQSGKASAPADVPGAGRNRKHPVVAANAKGQFIVAWTEGTAWSRGGLVAWQVFAPDGTPVEGQSGKADGLPVWSVPAVTAAADGTFRVMF